jgi:hypothetical protein
MCVCVCASWTRFSPRHRPLQDMVVTLSGVERAFYEVLKVLHVYARVRVRACVCACACLCMRVCVTVRVQCAARTQKHVALLAAHAQLAPSPPRPSPSPQGRFNELLRKLKEGDGRAAAASNADERRKAAGSGGQGRGYVAGRNRFSHIILLKWMGHVGQTGKGPRRSSRPPQRLSPIAPEGPKQCRELPGELAQPPLQPRMSPWLGLCSSARWRAARGASGWARKIPPLWAALRRLPRTASAWKRLLALRPLTPIPAAALALPFQPFSLSTFQPFQPFSLSTFQPFNLSNPTPRAGCTRAPCPR